VSLRRLFPDRWARILAWTSAALAWGTAAVAVATTSPAAETGPPPTDVPTQRATTTHTGSASAIPLPPEGGLVVIRYTPADRPAAQVITQTLRSATPAPAASSAPSSQAAAPAAAPQPTVTSSGS
jgi:hypothetical protein